MVERVEDEPALLGIPWQKQYQKHKIVIRTEVDQSEPVMITDKRPRPDPRHAALIFDPALSLLPRLAGPLPDRGRGLNPPTAL